MNEKMKLLVTKKGNKYYIFNKDYQEKETYPRSISWKIHHVDVKQDKCYLEEYVVTDRMPTKLYKTIPEQTVVDKYVLKPGISIEDLSKEVPADFFDYGDGDTRKNNNIMNFYDPVTRIIPSEEKMVECEFELIDCDCNPVRIKYPFISEFPYALDYPLPCLHKYPCYIKSEQLFGIVRKYVKENLTEHVRMTSDYDFTITVEYIIPVIHEETIIVKKGMCRRKRTEIVPLRSFKKTLLCISTPGHSYGDILPGMKANNYMELEKKIDDLLLEIKVKLGKKLHVCPQCKGYGILEDDTNVETKEAKQ